MNGCVDFAARADAGQNASCRRQRLPCWLEAGHPHVVGAQRKFVSRDGQARNSPSCLFGTPATAIIALRTTLETHIYRLLFAWVVITFVPCLTLARLCGLTSLPFILQLALLLWSAHLVLLISLDKQKKSQPGLTTHPILPKYHEHQVLTAPVPQHKALPRPLNSHIDYHRAGRILKEPLPTTTAESEPRASSHVFSRIGVLGLSRHGLLPARRQQGSDEQQPTSWQ